VNAPKTLLLTETGVEWLPNGSTAVNVGPIVRALKFLTEGRGDDRGVDETGSPLPDLMSLAFDVVESIIVGGRKADYFRKVKLELEAQGDVVGRSSLALAKQARRVQSTAPATALDHAAETLQALLSRPPGLPLDEPAARELTQALEAFRAFGADRWVSATAQLLVAVNALAGAPKPQASPRRAAAKKARKAPQTPVAAPRKKAAKAKTKLKAKRKPKRR
jgi:hypothetical protein